MHSSSLETLTVALVASIVLLPPQSEPAGRPPICDFVDKIIAARADDFRAIRSTVADPIFKTYDGQLTLDAQSSCTAFTRNERSRRPEGPAYICDIRKARSMADMRPVYDHFRADLLPCYPNFVFRDTVTGSNATRDEQWAVHGGNDTVTVMMYAVDTRFMADAGGDLIDDDMKRYPARLKLSVQDNH